MGDREDLESLESALLEAIEQQLKAASLARIRKTFYVHLVCNFLVNLDHGILPACTVDIKQELQVDDFLLGLLGSMVFGGLVLGSLLSGYLFTKYSSQRLLNVSIGGLCVAILTFPLFTSSQTLMIISRLLIGFCQVRCAHPDIPSDLLPCLG